MNMEERQAIYCLAHIREVGAVGLWSLYEYFGSFREVWKAGEKELLSGGLLTEKKAAAIFAGHREEEAYLKEFEGLEKRGIRFLTALDPCYPKRLLPLSDRPAALFVRGKLPDGDAPAAAIVGARNCTEYGRQLAKLFASELAAEGVEIISGLAVGIDGAAHEGALSRGKPTYAVLGCGADICYPKEHYPLFRRTEAAGGIISEFPPKTPPLQMNFPMRNRIISGLSDAVIIIEAREKSGSLITADLALDQGKDVFALPGRVTDPLSAGCNRLIQGGAQAALSPSDVLESLGIRREKKLTIRKKSENRLAKRENLVYSCLDLRPKHLEEIAAMSRLSVTECMESLLELELLGFASSLGNQYYCGKL